MKKPRFRVLCPLSRKGCLEGDDTKKKAHPNDAQNHFRVQDLARRFVFLSPSSPQPASRISLQHHLAPPSSVIPHLLLNLPSIDIPTQGVTNPQFIALQLVNKHIKSVANTSNQLPISLDSTGLVTVGPFRGIGLCKNRTSVPFFVIGLRPH